MAKTPATVIAEINQYIIANGVGAINGPILNGVLQDLCNLVPPTPLDSGLMGYDSSGNPLAVSGGGGEGDLLAANNLSDVASKTVSFNNISPMTTAGDIIYGGASGAATRLPAGTSAQVLFGGATPSWGTPSGGGTGLTIINSLAALVALVGTSGQVVYLDAGGRSGLFAWSSANHLTDVANDPGQGEWVAESITEVIVSGTLSPNVTGTYVLGGTYLGNPYYTQVGVGNIWYFAGGSEWVISVVLGDAAHQVWVLGGGASIPTSGNYAPFNGATGTAAVVSEQVGGSSGAWQRQWNGTCDWAWFGALDDTVCTVDPVTFASTVTSGTDNGVALLDWQTWAQHKSSLGIGVKVEPGLYNTGVYGWHQATTGYYWFSGIKKLHLNGRNVIQMQELTSGFSGGLQLFPIANSSALTTGNSFLIQNTTIGASAFSCVTASQAGNFVAGTYVLLASLDIQRIGFPPNCQNYEYRLITANGVIYTATIASAVYTSGTGALALTFAIPPFGTTSTTSTTSNTIGLGSKTFVVPLSLSIPVGQVVVVTATSGNTMTGNVVSYDGVTTGDLVINVTGITGSGTFASWTVAFTVLTVVGQWLTLASLTGTGSFASLDGAWAITSVTSGGLTVTVAATAGLTATVTGGNASTGVVPCTPILCNHLTTYPDFTFGGGFPCGAARAWNLPGWNNEHIYEKIQVNFSPNIVTGNGIYVSFTSRQITTIDWWGPGFSETVSQSIVHYRAHRMTPGETDKMVEEITDYEPIDSNGVGIGAQSATPKRRNFFGGKIGQLVGWGQRLHAVGTNFQGGVVAGCTYGLSYGGTLIDCLITQGSIGTSVLDGAAAALTIDGTNATYANGIITLNVSPLEAGELISSWNSVPGMILMLEGTPGSGTLSFTGDYGALLVFSLTWNGSTQIYMNTNGPAALPAWATGVVRKLTVGAVKLINCGGPELIRNASDATDNGKAYYEFYRSVIMGNTTNPYATSLEFNINGVFESFECDVAIAHPTSGATLAIQFRAYIITPSTLTADFVNITINIGVAGKRVINTTSFIGAQGTDSVSIGAGGASVQPIPTGHMLLLGTGTITAPGATSPVITVVTKTNCGISRKQIPMQNYGAALISSVVLPMQGQQQ